jgi:GNAT superfamily N-acetyltransferase
MVALVPMSSEESEIHLEQSRRQYVSEMAVADGVGDEIAERRVEEQMKHLLPDGPQTPGHRFLWILADPDQGPVGWTWLGPAGEGGDHYIYEIEIESAFRGRGLGGNAIDRIELLVAEIGATRLGLHVFEANSGARRLYESKGFVATQTEPGHLEMWKDLNHPAPG